MSTLPSKLPTYKANGNPYGYNVPGEKHSKSRVNGYPFSFFSSTGNSHVYKTSCVHRSAPASIRTSPRCSIPATPNDNCYKFINTSFKYSCTNHKNNSSHQKCTRTKSSSSNSSVISSSKTAIFNDYMPLCEIQKALKKGEVIEGLLRINPRDYENAYISAPDGLMDILIGGTTDRNRSLNGDKVVVKLNHPSKWKILYTIIHQNWNKWKDEIMNIIKEKTVNVNCKLTGISKENDENCLVNDFNIIKIESPYENKRKHNIENILKNIHKFNSFEIFLDKRWSKRSSNKTNSLKSSNLKKLLSELGLPNELANLDVIDFMKCSYWEHFIQRSGKVIGITKTVHPRLVGGKLCLKENNYKQDYALLTPTDSKVPYVLIPIEQCPPNFLKHPLHYKDSLFIVSIDNWQKNSPLPHGKVVDLLGTSGDVDTETKLILTQHMIDDSDFTDNDLVGLPIDLHAETYIIPKDEYLKRKDLTRECVFSIDPSTAKDIDDALSIKILNEYGLHGEKLFEIGVHIADVSYFVKEGMPCDIKARERGNSVYLVNKVIKMLPNTLSDNLCSLNSGADRLTFSIIWKMDLNGNIHDEWFGRSVIKSCAKLSYEMAQDMIDKPDRKWSLDELPKIYGNWTPTDISNNINLLMRIARSMRKRRHLNGAIDFSQNKIQFIFEDLNMKVPTGFLSKTSSDSNRLVEEFMLQANISVANKIYMSFPKLSILRRHPSPDPFAFRKFSNILSNFVNGEVDMTTSRGVIDAIEKVSDANCRYILFNYLIKSMKLAEYFCAGAMDKNESFDHFALAVPLYTHFTSPIRRYPDIIVHRLLGAILNYNDLPNMNEFKIHEIALHCNEKKKAARLASQASTKLFLSLFIALQKEVTESALVIDIFDHKLDAILLNFDQFVRIDLESSPIYNHVLINKYKKTVGMNIFWTKNINKIIVPRDIIEVHIKVNVREINVWNVTLKNHFLS